MRNNPERLAWTVLLTAFAAFCLAVIGCPLTVRSYLTNARQPLSAQVSSQRGTVRVERAGSSGVDATSLEDPPLELFKQDQVRTGDLAEGLLRLQRASNENGKTLISVVVYDNSDIVLLDAYSPRFGLGSDPHQAIWRITDGRVRIEIQPSADGRPVRAKVHTDRGNIHLVEGSYALEVTNQQVTVTVRSGEAWVEAGNQELVVTDEQRAVSLLDGTLVGPLSAERNLIVNGDFGEGLDDGWLRIVPADPTAKISRIDDGEQTAARFQHTEAQPLDIRLVQTLNRNIRDLESLVLHLKVRIDFQNVSICGAKGSECPVMVRVDYVDVAGGQRQWVHGFYAFEDPNLREQLPEYCISCPPVPNSGNHSRIPEQTWFLYDSPNLMEIVPEEARPAIIQSVHVYASGQQYDSLVTDVELLAQE